MHSRALHGVDQAQQTVTNSLNYSPILYCQTRS